MWEKRWHWKIIEIKWKSLAEVEKIKVRLIFEQNCRIREEDKVKLFKFAKINKTKIWPIVINNWVRGPGYEKRWVGREAIFINDEPVGIEVKMEGISIKRRNLSNPVVDIKAE